MQPRTAAPLVLAAALLAPATVALAEPTADTRGVEDEAPEGCTRDADARTITCPIPPGCEEDDRCELPDPCERVGDGMMRCSPPENGSAERQASPCGDEHACEPPEGRHPGPGTVEDVGVNRVPDPPEAEAPCKPHPDKDGAMICEPPPDCQGQVGQTPACTPPPFCEDNGDGTYTCTPPDEDEGPSQAPGPPDCESHPSRAHAMLCRPPPDCEGKIGQTPACTPPPECTANGDGTFTCTLPDHASPQATEPDRRDEDTVEESPAGEVPGEAEQAMREAVEDALATFRERLDQLRQQYDNGTEELRDTYEEKKEELREAYRACLQEVAANASRAERLDHERSCKETAREDLRQLREELLAERDLLREDLLGQAEDAKFQTCADLEETLHGILLDHGVTSGDIAAALAPGDLGLCSGILVGQDRASAASSGWLEGGGAS